MNRCHRRASEMHSRTIDVVRKIHCSISEEQHRMAALHTHHLLAEDRVGVRE